MFSLGWFETIMILVVALLLFGKRLPEVGRSLGRGILEFKKGLKGVEEELNVEEPPRVTVKPDEKPKELPKSPV